MYQLLLSAKFIIHPGNLYLKMTYYKVVLIDFIYELGFTILLLKKLKILDERYNMYFKLSKKN